MKATALEDDETRLESPDKKVTPIECKKQFRLGVTEHKTQRIERYIDSEM
jgi:hypothetical protein